MVLSDTGSLANKVSLFSHLELGLYPAMCVTQLILFQYYSNVHTHASPVCQLKLWLQITILHHKDSHPIERGFAFVLRQDF